MKKLSSLRRQILDAVPELAENPDRLLTFADAGRIEYHRGTNYDHRYHYTARLILTDYAGETDAVLIPVLYWLSIYEPDVDPDEAVQFEAEILNNDLCDLSLSVKLSERVKARLDCDTGRINAEHLLTRYDLNLICPPEQWAVYTRDQTSDGEYTPVANFPAHPGNGH